WSLPASLVLPLAFSQQRLVLVYVWMLGVAMSLLTPGLVVASWHYLAPEQPLHQPSGPQWYNPGQCLLRSTSSFRRLVGAEGAQALNTPGMTTSCQTPAASQSSAALALLGARPSTWPAPSPTASASSPLPPVATSPSWPSRPASSPP